ncbi:AraC family transcriptional regulator [Nocardia tengchongensis]
MRNELQQAIVNDPTLQEAVIPAGIVMGVLQFAEERGVDPEPWLSGTGLTLGQIDLLETRLSYRQVSTFLHRALRALPPGPLGLRVGARDVLMSWGLLGVAVRSCGSVGEAFGVGLQFHRATGTLLDYAMEPGPDEFALRIDERTPDPELLPFLCEETSVSIVSLLRLSLDNQVTPTRIEFAYPRPDYADAYSRFFRCAVHFGTPVTRMYFATELLDRRIPTANPGQLDLALEAARQLADPGNRHSDIVVGVEGVLRANLRHPVTMALVAGRLMISERTLQRRLTEAGEKFGEIRDRVRLQRAATLLRESKLPIATIAAEVGYSDSREFRRAYQRWTGRTPSAERASARA